MVDDGESSIVPKREDFKEDGVSSGPSPHEDEQFVHRRDSISTAVAPEGSPVQKRKGGRKPLYATTEERKQRNRRAQAAFRERRTEHIKQLEADMSRIQDMVKALETSQQKAKDECLMLRYKNSLLERLLVEKNIDFHAEIRQQGLSYSPAQVPRGNIQLPMHRSVLERRRNSTLSQGTRTPISQQSSSNMACNITSASPVIPPAVSTFTFQSPLQYPQQQAPQSAISQPPFLGPMRRQNAMSTGPSSPVNVRRSSMTGQWSATFQAGMQQSTGSFPVDVDGFGRPRENQVVQNQYQVLSSGPQHFTALGGGGGGGGGGGEENHYNIASTTIGQILEQGSSAQAMLAHHVGQEQVAFNSHAFSMTDRELSTLESFAETDPFDLDRNMKYPTQFDYVGTQRKQP